MGLLGSACRVLEPRMLERLTIRPAGDFLMSGSSSRVRATTAKTLVSKTRSSSESEACVGGYACIVDENVELAELLSDVFCGGFAVFFADNVELEAIGVDTGGAERGCGLFGCALLACAHENGNARCPELLCSFEAEAAIGAGDKCHLLFLRHESISSAGLDDARVVHRFNFHRCLCF